MTTMTDEHPIPTWLRGLVRLDFVAAVLLTVLAPLVLLLRACTRHREQLPALLAYWRSSSLLMVTVYLLVGERRIAFLTGIAARLLIPFTLRVAPPTTDRWFLRWRQAVRGYCLLGAVLNIPMLRCLRSHPPAVICRAYAEPPREFAALLHPRASHEQLGQVGMWGLRAFLAGAALVRGIAAWRSRGSVL